MMRGNGIAQCLIALVLVSLGPLAQAACPSAANRDALRAKAESAARYAIALPHWNALAAAARDCNDAVAEADALAELSRRGRRDGPPGAVIASETRRAELASRHALTQHEAQAHANLGKALVAKGELQAARGHFDIARMRFQALGDQRLEADMLSELSRLERRRGDYLTALREELGGIELRRRFSPDADITRSLLSLANLYEQIELFDESRKHYAAALAEAERRQVDVDIADALNGYAGFLNDFGGEDSRQALPMAERALALHLRGGDPARIGSCLLQVGRANLNLERYDQAEAAFRQAAELAARSGTSALGAHVDFRWGELDLARGDALGALERIEKARKEYERETNRHRLIKVHGTLERVYAALGNPLAAARAGREHFRLRNQLLGANATGKLGELLTNFALSDERLRNERLEQENAVAAIRLESDRRTRFAGFAVALVVMLALAALAWRYATMQRLFRLLRAKTGEIEAQGRAITEANSMLRQQSERLRQISITDSLTGMFTRAHGLEELGEMLATYRERGKMPSLLIIDIDHFKDVNDRHGHPAGDAVLVAVAQTLRDVLPADAVLARLGGEEFMVALDDGAAERAHVIADALRRRVRDLRVDVGSRTLNVTISLGLCSVAATASGAMRELFAGADEALYAAKHAGRDCVREFRVIAS